MEQDVLIDWNEAVSTLTYEEKKRVKALIDELQRLRLPPAEEVSEGEAYMPAPSPYYATKPYYTREDILQIVAKFPKKKRWTFHDLQNITYFPADIRIKIELINYKIFIGMDPKLLHQEILTNVSAELNMFVRKNKLGKTYVAPSAIKIDDGTILKPDILYISVSKSHAITDDCIETAPELVIEVISPANYKKLRTQKKELYANFGVQEYWEIYPKKHKIVIETIDETTQTFVPYSEAKKVGSVKSKVLDGFELRLEDIFG